MLDKEAWPITGATFALMRAQQDRPAVGAEVLKYFQWSYHNGSAIASAAGYVPLPDKTVNLLGDVWKQIKDANGKSVLVSQ